MKLTCLVLSGLFCFGLGLATEPPETEDELHERTLGEIGQLFHEGLLQLLPNHPKHNLKPLMHLYYLIQVISAYHHTPAHFHTDLDTLVQDLVDEDLQERLRWAIRRLHRFENIRSLREHPSIAENPRDKESFVNDIRRLLPAIHQALNAIHLERLHDPGLRTRLVLLRQKCDALTAEVIHTEYALLAFLGVPPERGVLLEAREELEDRLLRRPGHGLGLHNHHKSPLAEVLKQQRKQWHERMNQQRRQLQKVLHAKKAFFKKILHDKKAVMAAIAHKKKQIIKDLLDRKVDLKTLVEDIVENLNEQRKVFVETMSKNGEVLSEMLKDREGFFDAVSNQVSGPFTEMIGNVSVEGIVDAAKGVVADALKKKQDILKKVFHKPIHHEKHHGVHHHKGVVNQIIDKKVHAITNIVQSPLKVLQPAEEDSHYADVHSKEDPYEYENEPYEFKPEYYESHDPEEQPSERKLDTEEPETSEDLERLDKEANRLWNTEEPEARIINIGDDEVTLDYWTPTPAGKTTTTVRPRYEEDLEAATAQSEPLWLDVRIEGRSNNHEEIHVPDEDHNEEDKEKEHKSEIELTALYQVSTRILDLVAMLEDGAGFKGLNENISSNDMALIINHLAQQELDKMEEDRGITQPELIGGLKWLIEYKEVPDFERIVDVLELWRQAELLQVKVNAKSGKHPEKSYLVKMSDELEDDLGEDDADYYDEEDEDGVAWEEAPVPEADDGVKHEGRMVPDEVIESIVDSSGGISKDVKRSQPFPEENPDLTEPLEEKSPTDQETKRIQPFPEERPDETEPLEMV